MLTVLGRLLERNSIYVATIFGGAFPRFFDVAVNKWWEEHNKAKLWKTSKENSLKVKVKKKMTNKRIVII